MAARLEDTILVIRNFDPEDPIEKSKLFGEDNNIWIFNLWTEQWKAHTLHSETTVKDLVHKSQHGFVIASDVYILAAHTQGTINALWKLTKRNNSSFASTTISLIHKAEYVPGTGLCDWEHGNKLWIYGAHRDLLHRKHSNKLFCCDPSVRTLSSVICSGSFPDPLPRYSASAAVIKDKVWLCGGKDDFDFYELDMLSFSWTQIETGMPQPLFGNPSWITDANTRQPSRTARWCR